MAVKHQTGELRERITINKHSVERDPDTNRRKSVWHPVMNLSAKITPKEQLERFRGDQMEATATHLVVIRQPHPPITNEYQLTWGTRTLKIAKHRDPDNLGAWTEIEAGEDVN